MKIYLPVFMIICCLFSGCIVKTADSSKILSNNEYTAIYAPFLDSDEVEVASWYHYVTTKNSQGNYIHRTFFPETKQITSYTTFKSKNKEVKDGIAKKWYDNGSRRSEGQYKNNKQTGVWRYYNFDDNSLNRTGTLLNGEKNGLWKSYDNNGKISSEYTYKNGILEGEFIDYDSLSNISNQGIYKSDTIFQQTNPNDRMLVERMPMFSNCDHLETYEEQKACTDQALLQFIYKNIRYPVKARKYGVEGSALIRFVIDKNGGVKDLQVLNGICESIANESLRVLNKMPDWYKPGFSNDKPVKVYFNLPIKFRLE